MDPQLRVTAETRLTDAAAAAGLADPRPAYRERLRQLRESLPAAFEQAVAHYEQVVLPRLAEAEPLSVWLDYGRFLADLTGGGSIAHIDREGRAARDGAAGSAGDLVLFIPDDAGAEVLVMAEPLDSSAAQRATLDLLVHRRLVLG